MAAVERIDGQNVEGKQDAVDPQNTREELIGVGHGVRPSERPGAHESRSEERHERHVHQGPGGKAPECGGGALGRVDICDAAQRPEHNAVYGSPDLAAGQGVAKLVQKHDGKERKVLEGAPNQRGVPPLATADFDDRYDKPGPMQVEIDSRNAAEMDGTLTDAWHS